MESENLLDDIALEVVNARNTRVRFLVAAGGLVLLCSDLVLCLHFRWLRQVVPYWIVSLICSVCNIYVGFRYREVKASP